MTNFSNSLLKKLKIFSALLFLGTGGYSQNALYAMTVVPTTSKTGYFEIRIGHVGCDGIGCISARSEIYINQDRHLYTLSKVSSNVYTLQLNEAGGYMIQHRVHREFRTNSPVCDFISPYYALGGNGFEAGLGPSGLMATICSQMRILDTKFVTVANPISSPSSFTVTPSEVIKGKTYTLRWSNPSNATRILLFENSNPSPLLTWTGTLPTSHEFSNKPVGLYSYRLQACNSLECSSLSPQRTAKVIPNQSPDISWLNGGPHGDRIYRDQTKTLYVVATDSDGAIQGVEFFRKSGGSTQSLGFATRDTSKCPNCYRLNWSPDVNGSVELWAIAEDNLNATSSLFSQRATIVVDSNRPPSGRLVNPPSSIEQYSPVTLQAEAEDADGSVASVVFLLDGSPIGTGQKSGAIYQLDWSPQHSGRFNLSVKITDNKSRTHTSNTHALTVTAVTIPPVPGGLTIDGEAQPGINRSGNYTLSWNPSAGATDYELEQSKDGAGFQPLPTPTNVGHFFPIRIRGTTAIAYTPVIPRDAAHPVPRLPSPWRPWRLPMRCPPAHIRIPQIQTRSSPTVIP